MLTRKDLSKRFNVTTVTIDRWHKSGVLPAALQIGERTLRWREEDIQLWEDWLAERVSVKKSGEDPDSPSGPAPPIYSTGCQVMDPRQVTARLQESKRRGVKPPKVETEPAEYEKA